MTSFDRPAAADEPAQEDLNNIELLNEYLLSDDPKRLETAKTFLATHGIDAPRFEMIVRLRRLREEVHRQNEVETAARVERNPMPNEEELSMGAYGEMIESTVRDAVLTMRHKGYNTLSSGFNELDMQSTNFSGTPLAGLDEASRSALEGLGAILRENSVTFRSETAEPEDIRRRWQKIAEALPDLGHPADPSPSPIAKMFRDRADRGELKKWYGRE
jgi:hypothetical protein